MTKRYERAWWSVELPSGWSAEEEEDCVTFSAKRGVGALQISAFRHNDKDVTDEDLREFAEDELVGGAKPTQVICGAFLGIEVSYTADKEFWRKLWLREGSVLLYATYNCRAEDRVAEIEAINRMLNSLEPK